MKIQATVVFEKNLDALNSGKRFIINEGGSRSSKTYSLCQLIILDCIQDPKADWSIVRKTLPALKATVLEDFIEVLDKMKLTFEVKHHETKKEFTFPNGAKVDYFSVDDSQKVRGRKRRKCWCNEANELLGEDFVQLNLRTEDQFLIDYNPSDSSSWTYELDPNDSVIIKSTYKDNPFLTKNIIKSIEDLKRTDEDLYQIYALGKRIISRQNIYNNWEFVSEKPERFTEFEYGLDFGWNHPTVLMRVYFRDNELFWEPVIYQSYLTNPELIEKMKTLNIETHKFIECDWARPEFIHELITEGFNAQSADKAVKSGIDTVKTFKVYCLDTPEMRKEYENYKWRKVKDQIIDEPLKVFDDGMDAGRYATKRIKREYYSNDGYLAF